MGQLPGLYFICQIILGLLLFSQWGLFTEPFGLLDEKENLSLPFFPSKLKLSRPAIQLPGKPVTQEKKKKIKKEQA